VGRGECAGGPGEEEREGGEGEAAPEEALHGGGDAAATEHKQEVHGSQQEGEQAHCQQEQVGSAPGGGEDGEEVDGGVEEEGEEGEEETKPIESAPDLPRPGAGGEAGGGEQEGGAGEAGGEGPDPGQGGRHHCDAWSRTRPCGADWVGLGSNLTQDHCTLDEGWYNQITSPQLGIKTGRTGLEIHLLYATAPTNKNPLKSATFVSSLNQCAFYQNSIVSSDLYKDY
jgi:hypothetical protein